MIGLNSRSFRECFFTSSDDFGVEEVVIIEGFFVSLEEEGIVVAR